MSDATTKPPVYPVSYDVPNDVTRAAMAELAEMKRNPEKYPRYKTTKEMFDAILSEPDDDDDD